MPRIIPAGIAAKLLAGTTTLCFCWKLTLRNATVLAYTSNMDTVTVGGIDYLPAAGLLSMSIRAELGTGIDSASVLGVIDDDEITAESLLNGDWDDARIEIFLADYENTTETVACLTGYIGEVANEITAFVAEVRSLLQRAAQQVGYLCSAACKAQLGDTACGVLVSFEVGSVTSVISSKVFRDTGLIGGGADYYQFGLVAWSSGANAGATHEIKRYATATGEFELQETPAGTIQAGDGFTVSPGCDKTLDTCKTKFNNIVRFRGEPFIPGTDAVLRVIR